MRKFIIMLFAVLVCSMAVFATNYIDGDTIVNKEAITMLSDLGIISGYEDGSFRPYNTITREEVSSIIANLATKELPATKSISFVDTQNSWASQYIEYCAQTGIISGSNGKFRPKDNVTGYELVKMLLVLLGHDDSQFVGSGWTKRVEEIAKVEGLTVGFSGDYNQYVSRDKTAYLINNALQCKVVEGYNGLGNPQYTLDMMRNPLAFLEIRFGAKLVHGVLNANGQYDFREEPVAMEENTIHIEGYAKNFLVSEEISNNHDLLGHKITVYAITGNDYNRIVGTVKLYSNEVVIDSINTYDSFQMIIEKTPLDLAKDVRFISNYYVVDQADVEKRRDEISSLKMVDHDNDSTFDYIFVTFCEVEAEESTAENMEDEA